MASLAVSGIILTKLDGDARGGAALSIREMVGKPILFSGIGEKLDAFEPFYPDRLASRILGMGDVLSLIDKVQQNVEQKEAENVSRRLFKNSSSRWKSFTSSSNRSSEWAPLAACSK